MISYQSLRSNASLKTIAETATRNAKIAKAEWKRYNDILVGLKHNATVEQLATCDRLLKEFVEAEALANHLNRIAK